MQTTLALMKDVFIAHLPERLAALTEQLAAVERGESCALETLHRAAHSLVGAAGVHRLMGVSDAAHSLEQVVAALQMEKAIGQGMDALREALQVLVAEVKHPSHKLAELPRAVRGPSSRIMVVDDDEEQANWLRVVLEQAGYRVEVIHQLADFRAACESREAPAAVIMDMVFPEGDDAGAQSIAELKEKHLSGLPVIFLSVRDDMEAKLVAYRAGATRYLTKPVDREKLLRAVGDSASLAPQRPYRVLMVDDDPVQLEIHAYMLRQSGMEVREVENPLLVPQILESFAAETLVLDMYMPQCSGPELAAILRENEEYAEMPIVYLSSERDISRQLLALDRNGDYFLTKPVEPRHLTATVALHARRYRQAREQAETLRATLYERERQQQAIDAHAIISMTDVDGNIIYVNERFCDISGYSRAELIGSNHRIVNSGQHSSAYFEKMWETITSGKIWQGEVCNRRKDGSFYWVESSIVPFLDAHGQPYQYFSIRTDISHVKEAQDRLRLSQIYANIGTWDWNILNGEVIWSERVGPLLGYPEGAGEATYENFLAAVHPDDRQSVVDAVTACLERRAEYNIEHRCVWPDGTVRWLLERGDVGRDSDGNPLHMLGLIQDITELKQAEAALILARDAAEFASRAKSEFLASMSHELRTPLNAILGFSQLFGMNPNLPEDTKEQAYEIERAGQHLLSLINDLIDLARIEAGKLELSLEPVSVKSVLDDSLSMVAPIAHRQGIALIENCGDGRGATVRADYVRLRQVVINLLSNAIKYNRPHGTVRLFCHIGDVAARISLADTGVGIPVDKQSRIFKAFDRLGKESGTIEGTGIGLIITQRIVAAMGGSIGFESIEGQGSTFWVELPLAASPELPVMGDAAIAPSSSESRPELTRPVVLYVEDNPMNLRLMQQIFSVRKHLELRDAHTAELGIELARVEPPALILMDINLPGMDGFTALEILKADPKTAHVPVVAVSANAMKGDEERGAEAGFVTYITKPLDVSKFLKIIDSFFGK